MCRWYSAHYRGYYRLLLVRQRARPVGDMHDRLFNNQQALGRADLGTEFREYLRGLDL